jgi:hypothetical protein
MSETRDESADEPEAAPTSKEDLEALFDAWDERRAAEADLEVVPDRVKRAWRYDPFRLWLSLTILIVAIASTVMWTTRHEVAYFMERGQEPTDLGRLSERWRAGERDLAVTSNRYVTARGMFTTYEAELAGEDGQKVATEHIYLCPLFNIAVRTAQTPPEKPIHRIASITVDEAYLELLQGRRLFPADLTVETGATGRLVRGSDVPPWHTQVLKYFALQVGADPYDLWLLIDGERPESARPFAFVWLASIVTILVALGLFLRAWLRRRTALRATS